MKKALLIMMTFFLSNSLTYAQTPDEGIYSVKIYGPTFENHVVWTITYNKKNRKFNGKSRKRDGKPREKTFKEFEIVSGEKINIKDESTSSSGKVSSYLILIRSVDNWDAMTGIINRTKPIEKLGIAKIQGEFSSGVNVLKMYSDKSGSKEVATKSTGLGGYKDIKFGMTYDQIKAAGICEYFAYADEYDSNAFAESCYKVAGKKRHMMFYFTSAKKNDLNMIHIQMGDSTNAYFNKLVKGIGKKYKETYRLTRDQQFSENKGDMIVFFADSRITLRQFSKQIHLFYTREVSPLYTKFAPKDVSSDDF